MTTTLTLPATFGDCKRAWGALSAPPADLAGRFDAGLVGPKAFQAVARFALAQVGFAGWQGKAFDGRGGGINLMLRGGRLEEHIPMRLSLEPSALDGRPALFVRYPAGSRWPWPHFVDELRVLAPGHLLGMTHTARGPLVATPFLLHQR